MAAMGIGFGVIRWETTVSGKREHAEPGSAIGTEDNEGKNVRGRYLGFWTL
jgi:hypothetical protein